MSQEHQQSASARLAFHRPPLAIPAVDRLQTMPSQAAGSLDPVTGSLAFPVLRATLDSMEPARQAVAVASFGFTDLAAVIEIHGFDAGDQILAEAGRRLAAVGSGRLLARSGDADFLMVLPAGGQVAATVEAARAALARPYRAGPVDLRLSVAAGYAVSPDDGMDGATLIRRAVSARRVCLDAGRRAARFDAATAADGERRRRLAADILPAIDRQEFQLHFQPIVSLATGITTGAEALLRWTHPDLGPIRADVAIAVAEETGHIEALGEWVLRKAAAIATAWPEALSVSVNVSPLQLRRPGFARMVRSALADTRLPRHRLFLEITESTLLDDRSIAGMMERLADVGVRFALDDFGTGFASMQTLVRHPFQRIKLDRSFASGLPRKTACRAVVNAVADLGRALHKEVVVEGIETAAEAACLEQAGIGYGQGHFYAPALEASAFRQFIAGQGV